MKVETIEAKFMKACIEYGKAIEEGNSVKANRQSKVIRDIRQKLIQEGNVCILEKLLMSSNEYVLLNVASSIINELPERAITILEELGEKKGLFSVDARMFLDAWKNGRINQ